MKCRRQNRCPTYQHRCEHRGRGTEMEQRHRCPQRLTGAELPGRRGCRGRGEQVVPCGGNGFRRPGCAGSEEQRSDVARRRRCVRRPPQRCRPANSLKDNGCQARQLIGQLGDPRLAFSVGDNHLRPRQSERVQQEVALVGRVHRGGHRADATGTQPEVDPLRTGRGEQRDTVAWSNTQVQQSISGRAGTPTHLFEGHVDTVDRHHHPVGNCSARRSRTAATLNRSTPKSAGPIGFPSHAGAAPTGTRAIRLLKPSQPPGPDRRWRCSRSRLSRPLRPGRNDAPSAAAPRSRAPPPVRGSASPGTSCSPR